MQLIPTTTLAKETANNTSASDTFKGNTVGAIKPGNISKISYQELLPNPDTKVIIHLMGWWKADGWHDSRSTINVGYSSVDPKQIAKQLADMKSRGATGIAIDWYGAGTISDKVLLGWKAACEADGKFEIIAQPDSGIYKGITIGADAQKKMVTEMAYVAQTYFTSPIYTRFNERPVLPFFINTDPGLNWPALKTSMAASNPLFIFRDKPGFTKTTSDGSFSWIHNLDAFYIAGKTFPSKLTIGSICPGFDNTLAPWGTKQIIPQAQGQHWLDCFAIARKNYPADGPKLWAVMGVTWNDYEEGSEMETGMDGGLGIIVNVVDDKLTWGTSGNPNALSHLEVYASSDGLDLCPMGSVNPQEPDFDLAAAFNAIDAGDYKIFVQAVGQPSILNAMSVPVPYTWKGLPPPPPPPSTMDILFPVAGANTNPVRIVATSKTIVQAMQVFIDDELQASHPGVVVNDSMNLKPGTHVVEIRAVKSPTEYSSEKITVII